MIARRYYNFQNSLIIMPKIIPFGNKTIDDYRLERIARLAGKRSKNFKYVQSVKNKYVMYEDRTDYSERGFSFN